MNASASAPIYTKTQKKTQKDENAKKNENAKEVAKNAIERKRMFSRTKTHIFMDEDAYFQERRRKKTKKDTQILGERCQLSSGEYCMTENSTINRFMINLRNIEAYACGREWL